MYDGCMELLMGKRSKHINLILPNLQLLKLIFINFPQVNNEKFLLNFNLLSSANKGRQLFMIKVKFIEKHKEKLVENFECL